MHILLTNDDGPPSALSSPYILAFARALESAGHIVSVVIPSEQRSWIGKAHIVGRDVVATTYWPDGSDFGNEGGQANGRSAGESENRKGVQPWILVDSTPATCAQLGLSEMFFKDRGKVDLGRNTTAVFALSSGTLGAALEAAVCGHRAIALSFAFFDRTNAPDVVAEACSHAVRVCEWLATNASWDDCTQLYSVNVPLRAGVSQKRVVWTRMLQNQWRKGACFEEISSSADEVAAPETEEAKVRDREARRQDEESNGSGGSGNAASSEEESWRPRHFKWAPRFTDVYESVEAAGPGTDGWAVKEGETSITAIKPNFMHVEGLEGEVKL